MRKLVLFVGGSWAVVGLFAATTVMAGCGRHHDPERFGAKVLEHIEEALEDKAPLTEQQHKAVADLIQRTQSKLKENHQPRRAQLDKALALFTQDTLDPAAVAELRAQHEARARATSEAFSEAFVELHDVLTPKQREVLAAELREHMKRWRD